jgi:hypothetical protein
MPQPSYYLSGQIIHQHYKRPRSPTELPVAEQNAILLQLSKEKYIYLPKCRTDRYKNTFIPANIFKLSN